MPELLKMKGCPQPRNWHSEGDVWKHTILALQRLSDKKFLHEFPKTKPSNELIWAIIFHDIGKPYTIRRADRLHFDNHDSFSANKFLEIAERLKLASAGLNINAIEKMVGKHMMAVHTKTQGMKPTTIEKYFYNDAFPGAELMMLIYADSLATVLPSGKTMDEAYQKFKKQIKAIKPKGKSTSLPKPLVNGHDLIKEFKLPEGPKIGKFLAIAREAQLANKIKTKADGLKLIKKYL
jgi:hypothetical protein